MNKDRATFFLYLVAAWLVGIVTVLAIQKIDRQAEKKKEAEREAIRQELREELESEYGKNVTPESEPEPLADEKPTQETVQEQEAESESEPEPEPEPIVYEKMEYTWISDYSEIDSSYSSDEVYRFAETIDPAVSINCTSRAKYFLYNAHIGRVLKDLMQRFVADNNIKVGTVNVYGDTRTHDKSYYVFHVCFDDDAWQKQFYRFEIYAEPFAYRILSPDGINIAEGWKEYQTEGFNYINEPYDGNFMNYPLGIDASQSQDVFAWEPLTEYSKNQKPDRNEWIEYGAATTALQWTRANGISVPLFALESALQEVNWDSYTFDIRAQSVSMQAIVLIVYRDYNYWIFTCNSDMTWDVVECSYGQETRKITGQVSYRKM